MIDWWKSGCLPFVLIVLLIIFGVGSCDYALTKSALTDLRGREPKPTTVIWFMLKGDNSMVRGGK